MAFPQTDAIALLVQCHRRCCICHRFCGVKLELDHIVPGAEDGPDSIDNAIAVCFECHAEIHSYNDQHPRGRKFRPDELRQHKEQWLEICRNRPSALLATHWERDVGPLQAMVDELEFNEFVATRPDHRQHGCLFLTEQFRRAISEGVISILEDEIKKSIIQAYQLMGKANEYITAATHPADHRMRSEGTSTTFARESIQQAFESIQTAREKLLSFLASEDESKSQRSKE